MIAGILLMTQITKQVKLSTFNIRKNYKDKLTHYVVSLLKDNRFGKTG